MRLSEAIRMGSLLVPEPMRGDTRACAIGMGLLSHGKIPVGSSTQWEYEDYERIADIYPWLQNLSVPCPWCSTHYFMSATEVIWHPFDAHVMSMLDSIGLSHITLEQLCDWLDTLQTKYETPKFPAQSVVTDETLCSVK